MSTANNRCAQCGKPQVIDGVEHPMTHIAARGLNSRPEDVLSLHLDCLPYDVEQSYRDAGHGPLIDKIKGDSQGDYAARRQWAQDHAAALAAPAGKDGE